MVMNITMMLNNEDYKDYNDDYDNNDAKPYNDNENALIGSQVFIIYYIYKYL